MCFTKQVSKRRNRRQRRNTCISRPLNDAWQGSGDSIGFKKVRKKNILNSNGPKNRIHPEPSPDTGSASAVKRH